MREIAERLAQSDLGSTSLDAAVPLATARGRAFRVSPADDGFSGRGLHSSAFQLIVSTFCGLQTSTFRLDVSSSCGLCSEVASAKMCQLS